MYLSVLKHYVTYHMVLYCCCVLLCMFISILWYCRSLRLLISWSLSLFLNLKMCILSPSWWIQTYTSMLDRGLHVIVCNRSGFFVVDNYVMSLILSCRTIWLLFLICVFLLCQNYHIISTINWWARAIFYLSNFTWFKVYSLSTCST